MKHKAKFFLVVFQIILTYLLKVNAFNKFPHGRKRKVFFSKDSQIYKVTNKHD